MMTVWGSLRLPKTGFAAVCLTTLNTPHGYCYRGQLDNLKVNKGLEMRPGYAEVLASAR